MMNDECKTSSVIHHSSFITHHFGETEMSQTATQMYKMRLEYFTLGGESVLEVPLGEQDFAHAVEWAFFEGLRRGRFATYTPPTAGVRIEPRFASRRGTSPQAAGFT